MTEICERRVRRGRLKLVLCGALLVAGCAASSNVNRPSTSNAIDLQGHRGARGLLPENTVPSFLRALELGVDTIELDVGVTADRRVVVSHEPWFSHEICSKPDGSPVTEGEASELNIYRMTYEEVSQYDCGLRGNQRFPRQEAMAVSKPLMSEVIDETERYVANAGRPLVAYNVEIKSKVEGDEIYHPSPDDFARLVYDVLADKDVLERSIIQSFDPRALESVHRIDADVTVALLVDNDLGLDANLERLSFSPDVYSPNHRLVDRALVEAVHASGLKIVPWTVNDEETMQSLLRLGIDGIITDYPGLGRSVIDGSR